MRHDSVQHRGGLQAPEDLNEDADELSDEEVPGLTGDEGDPDRATLHDAHGASGHTCDSESIDESEHDQSETDGAGDGPVAAVSILHLFAHELLDGRAQSHMEFVVPALIQLPASLMSMGTSLTSTRGR